MKEETTNLPATPELEYKTLRIYEEGRDYKTTLSKKYETRTPWVRPNPEEIKTFIPGSVQKILVATGQEVKAGDELILFEAMKMRNVIRAPFAGKVTAIPARVGDKLPRGAIMLTLKHALPESKKKKEKKKKGRSRI